MTQGPDCPVVVRVLSDAVLWQAGACPSGELTWTVGQSRPDGFGASQILRMFVTEEGVEVYYRGELAHGPQGPQNVFGRVLLPSTHIRAVEEMMSEEVFARELSAAQNASEDEAEDDGDADDEDDAAGSAERPAAQRPGAHA